MLKTPLIESDAVLHTPLTELLGIQTPIVSAAMGGVANSALAVQVSLAGGFGFCAPLFITAEACTQEFDTARATLGLAADAPLPIGAGFLGWVLDTDKNAVACLDVALAQRVKAVWFSFGDDLGKWVQHVRTYDSTREHKTLVWVVVNTVEEAQRAAREWHADVLVVQGIESGGHGAAHAPPLLTLLPMVRRALPDGPPLVAAGGLVSGAHVAAMLMLGAAGAVLGTRFVLTTEATAAPSSKEQMLAASDTVRTLAYDEVRGHVWPAGIDGRALRNEIYEDQVKGLGLAERKRLFEEAVKNKDASRSVVWAGASVGLVTEMSGAGALVKSLHNELLAQLGQASAILG